MQKAYLAIAASAALLASAGAQAQESPAAQQDRPGMTTPQHGGGADRPGGRADAGRHGGMRSGMGHGMMGHRMMGHRMMGPGMMGHGRTGPGMLTIMMAIVDTNTDRALSLEEVQAAHARIFKYADADSDGKLTEAELRRFFHGGEADDDD